MNQNEIIDAVLEDVVDRLVLEHGYEVAALDWGIITNIRESLEKPEEDTAK